MKLSNMSREDKYIMFLNISRTINFLVFYFCIAIYMLEKINEGELVLYLIITQSILFFVGGIIDVFYNFKNSKISIKKILITIVVTFFMVLIITAGIILMEI